MAVVGAGIAGLMVGAELRKVGIERIRLIDEAGGVGGTWYWNRYPGVMCDVESYIYMPLLEERGYVPTRRYAFGDEIREHLEWIADEVRAGRRCPVPHDRADVPSGTRSRRCGSSEPTGATRSRPASS